LRRLFNGNFQFFAGPTGLRPWNTGARPDSAEERIMGF